MVERPTLLRENCYSFITNLLTEEKIRLKEHCSYFLETLKEKNSGKKLGFITQEMGREINTIGSKSSDAEIQKISKDLYRCAGQLKGYFKDVCQNCLKDTRVEVSNNINVTIKDLTEMHNDSSDQDQTHYQDLEYFDLHRFIEEELAIIYPDIVKCSENCIEGDISQDKEKILPFKKIRDLIE